MALHLNLLHEVQRQRRARKRDPLKLSIYGLVLVVAGFIGYYFLRAAGVNELTAKLAGIETEWQGLEPKKKAAEEREIELTGSINASESLVRYIEGRFYWAPILERIMEAVPREVQVTRFEASRAAGKPVSLVVNGISSGTEPRRTAEDLRTALEQKLGKGSTKVNSSFRLLEDSEEKVQLAGKVLPTATFSIQIELAQNDSAPAGNPKRDAKK
jgi:hypothetical protein